MRHVADEETMLLPDAERVLGERRLAELGAEMMRRRFELAAGAWEGLATHFPQNRRDGWWRAGELYRDRVKDPARAKEAYGKVPAGSARYKDAQERLR